MSDTPPRNGAEGWWQATDGKWYPPESHPEYRAPQPTAAPTTSTRVPRPELQPGGYLDWRSRRFYPDPSGRHNYRQFLYGEWTSLVCEGPGKLPTRDPEGLGMCAGTHPPEIDVDEDEVEGATSATRPSDAIATFLQVVGWFVVVLSVIAGVVVEAQSITTGGVPLLGPVVGFAGVVQGILLVGFGRIISYLFQIAANTRRSADLIDESLHRRR